MFITSYQEHCIYWLFVWPHLGAYNIVIFAWVFLAIKNLENKKLSNATNFNLWLTLLFFHNF